MDPLTATQTDLASAQAVGAGTGTFPGAPSEVARQRQADQSSAILKLKLVWTGLHLLVSTVS